MVHLAGDSYVMGSDEHYPEEAPAHLVRVDPFWIDVHAVTNRDFAAFVEATGYVTVAERQPDPDDYPGAQPGMMQPGALVFTKATKAVDLRNPANWWRFVPGASWRAPLGPGSRIDHRLDHPVVHVAYNDALAYAQWAGKDLPTEAEWEYAARGGLQRADYCWGDVAQPEGRPAANTWQGRFPWHNTKADGFEGTAPVGSYAPNGFGLYDMAGNVWEWTADWWCSRHARANRSSCCTPVNPRGGSKRESLDPRIPAAPPRKVIKGGSFLCSPEYCLRYRPAARQPQTIDTAMSHIGFRCVRRVG